MALVVEDGTGIPGADSYISEADGIARAQALGFNFPTDTADAEPILRAAAQYLETYRNSYQGTKLTTDQGLQWPRQPVYIDGVLQDPNTIPQMLIDAQVYLASFQYDGGNYFSGSTGTITSKSVGDVSVSYGSGSQLYSNGFSEMLRMYLDPLLKSAAYGLGEFRVDRA